MGLLYVISVSDARTGKVSIAPRVVRRPDLRKYPRFAEMARDLEYTLGKDFFKVFDGYNTYHRDGDELAFNLMIIDVNTTKYDSITPAIESFNKLATSNLNVERMLDTLNRGKRA